MDEERFKRLREKYDRMLVTGVSWINADPKETVELLDEIERMRAELEQWRNGTRVRSSVDTTLMGFGVDDYDELFGE